MTNTTFIPGTVIESTWLNEINDSIYEATQAPVTGGFFSYTFGRTASEIAAGVTPSNYAYTLGDVRRYGAVLNGIVDDSAALQRALNALASTGGTVFIPPSPGGTRCLFATGLQIPDGVGINGSGMWSTILRYSGTGTALIAKTTGNETCKTVLKNFTLQLSGVGSIGIDASRWMYSYFNNIRVAFSAGSGHTGITANITNATWSPYQNDFGYIVLDGLATGWKFDSSVSQYANRWVVKHVVFTDCTNGFNIQKVQGLTVIFQQHNEHTGVGITLGSGALRVSFIAIEQETSAGGSLWSVNAACNRLRVGSVIIHAGTDGSSTGLGIRNISLRDWDKGISFTGDSIATQIAKIGVSDNLGVKISGLASLGNSLTEGNNLSGTVTFSSAATKAVAFGTNEPDTNYRVLITGRANENFWASSIATTGFTINSSNATSVAVVDWFIVR